MFVVIIFLIYDTRWEYLTTRADYSINVRPHPMMLGKALADYVAKVGDDGFV